jgi:hypothetical protein
MSLNSADPALSNEVWSVVRKRPLSAAAIWLLSAALVASVLYFLTVVPARGKNSETTSPWTYKYVVAGQTYYATYSDRNANAFGGMHARDVVHIAYAATNPSNWTFGAPDTVLKSAEAQLAILTIAGATILTAATLLPILNR